MKHPLLDRLEREEGRRNEMYKDSEGIWTIGIGWNIQERGLPDEIVDRLFEISVADAEKDARKLPEFHILSEVRQSVLIAMVFQMGLPRVKKFKKFRAALQEGDYNKAAKEMLDSLWHRQMAKEGSKRAIREARIMRRGKYND